MNRYAPPAVGTRSPCAYPRLRAGLERSTGEYSFDPDLLRHRRHAAERRDEIRRLEAATCAMMARLDRWARATRDLLNILDAIGKAGAGFKSLVTLAEKN
jgi:hypothetical protein